MALQVRNAKPNDVDQLVAFQRTLLLQDGEVAVNTSNQLIGFKTILIDRRFGQVLVAEDNEHDQLLGMIAIIISFSTALGQKTAILEDLFVAKTHRRHGIAQALLNGAFAYCKDQNIEKVSLQTLDDNVSAQALFADTGFKLTKRISYRKFLD